MSPATRFYELDWVFLHEHPPHFAAALGVGVARGASVSAPGCYSRSLTASSACTMSSYICTRTALPSRIA